MAFRQAIELEGDVPARYMALAKAEEKLGKFKKSVEALENAYELDPNVGTLRQILAIYEGTGDTAAAAATTARIEEQITKDSDAKNRRNPKASFSKTTTTSGSSRVTSRANTARNSASLLATRKARALTSQNRVTRTATETGASLSS